MKTINFANSGKYEKGELYLDELIWLALRENWFELESPDYVSGHILRWDLFWTPREQWSLVCYEVNDERTYFELAELIADLSKMFISYAADQSSS